MDQDRFKELANEVAAEGDNFAAATILFVGQLHLLGSRSDLLFLSSVAQHLATQACTKFEREEAEQIAVKELVSQL